MIDKKVKLEQDLRKAIMDIAHSKGDMSYKEVADIVHEIEQSVRVWAMMEDVKSTKPFIQVH